MAAHVDSDNYQKGLEWADAGQYEQGWDCLREHLCTAPQDVQAPNDECDEEGSWGVNRPGPVR